MLSQLIHFIWKCITPIVSAEGLGPSRYFVPRDSLPGSGDWPRHGHFPQERGNSPWNSQRDFLSWESGVGVWGQVDSGGPLSHVQTDDSQTNFWGKIIPCRETSKWKGPETETCLVCWRSRKKTNVFALNWVKRKAEVSKNREGARSRSGRASPWI